MKPGSAFCLFILLLVFLATSQCQKPLQPTNAPDVSKLDELPKDVASTLRKIPETDIYVSSPQVSLQSKPNGPLPAPKECQVKERYFYYVIFPSTICTRDQAFLSNLENVNATLARSKVSAPPTAGPPRDFKLSGFEGEAFALPLYCRTTSGPWGAIIDKTTSCEGISLCVMTVYCSQCPSFVWNGEKCESTGRPAQVDFIGDPYLMSSFSSGCGGLSNCGQGNPTPTGPALR